jgi:uncharacterized membrane protein YraQ (UPF0718 family)
MKKAESGGRSALKFLGAVCLVYVAVGIAIPGTALSGLGIFWSILLSILPVMVLVFAMMFVTNLFMKPKRVVKYLGGGSGLRGWLFAIGGGIISTGPAYMWYKMLADLREHGMKESLIAAFIYNRAVKIPLIPIMVYYFGWIFTATLTIYMLAFSVINGFIVGFKRGEGNEDSG